MNDVAKNHPETVKQLAAEWDQWEQEVGVIKGYQEFWERKDAKAGKGGDEEDE